MDKKLNVKNTNTRSRLIWIGFIFLFLVIPILAGSLIRRYRTLEVKRNPTQGDLHWSSQSFGLAPHPTEYRDAVVQVYCSRTRGPKGALAVHTWVATKRSGADQYKVSQVIGWRLKWQGTALFSEVGIPDKSWHGNVPSLLLDLRGAEVERIIDKIDLAIDQYPWKNEYTVWPGPNSNTFIAWLGLQVPDLGLDLPSTAIGKDWRPIDKTFGWSASGTGVQASLYGLVGATLGRQEGLEINILGLSVELDLFDLAMELPGIGRLGAPEVPGGDLQFGAM